jgi:hypothetical protein
MRYALLLVLVGALALPAPGQVIYQTRFDDIGGWSLPPQGGPKDPHWDVDNRPGQAPFGPVLSPPYSLNYNNDVDYNGFAIPGETARSPQILLGTATGIPILSFWCNNLSCEGTCNTHERFRVYVRQASTTLTNLCLNWAGYYEPIVCIKGGGWHPHHLVLDKSWGAVTIDFEVRHDGIANSCEGWFVDDLSVIDYPAPTIFCTAKVNSKGCTPQIATSGTPSLTSGPPLVISVTQVLNNKNGILFYGLGGPAAIPFQGGFLCSAPPRHRTPQQQSGGNPPPNDCSGQFAFDFRSWALSGKDPALSAGVQVVGQFWYRDAGAPFSTGLSDAVDFFVLP